MSQQKIFFEIEFKGSKELFDQIDLLRLKIQQVNESLKGTSIDGLSSQLKAEFERAKKVVDTFNKVSGGKGADSSTNIQSPVNTKPVEIPVKFKLDGDQDIIKQFVEVEQRIKALKDEGKVALKLGDSERLGEIKQEVEGLTIARSKLNKEIKEGAKNNEEFPTGSIQDLTQKVRILAKEYNLLSEEEREATDRGKDLGKQLGEARVKLNQAKLAVNDYTSNIGNYEGATNNLYLKIKALATATANGNKEVIASLQGDIKAIRIATEKDIDALLKDYQKLSAQEKNSSKGRDKLTLISQAQSQLGGIDKAVGDLDSKVNPLKAKFLSVGDIVTGGLITGGITAAIGSVVSFGQSSVEAFNEAQRSIAKVETVIKSTGGAAGFTVDELKKKAEELQNVTAFDGDEILEKVTAPLLTFTKIQGKTFEDAQKAALDLSTLFGGDLQSASLQLGKALQEPSKGLVALRKSGISFSETQIDQIKRLEQTNQLAKAQAIILEEVNKQVGGQAEAFAKTDAGKIQQITNKFESFKETIGGFISQGIGKIAQLVEPLIEPLINVTKELFSALAPLGVVFSDLFSSLTGGTKVSEVFSYVWDKISSLLFSTTQAIETTYFAIKDLIKTFLEIPGVGATFEFVFDGIISLIGGFLKKLQLIPAGIAGIYAVIDQFIKNIKNLDFSQSALAAGDKAFKQALDARKKSLQDAEDAKKQAAAAAKAEAEAKKQAIAEAEAAKKKAADAKKEREKLDKELEDQYRRLNELRRSIKQLASENIDNVFDKQIIDAKNRTADELAKLEENRKKVQDKIKGQKGKETKLDKDELDYIDQQTKQIKDKLNKQTLEINQKRREAFEQQQDQLRKNRDEANKILLNTRVTGLSERLGNIKTGAEDKIQTIKLDYEINKEKLDDQLKAGLLSQKEYEAQINSLEISSKSEQEAIIKERNKRILAIYDEYLLLRKGQIETERDIAISDLGIEESKALESVDEKLKRGEIESVSKANEAKDAIEQLYAQKRIAINENAANEISKLNKDSAKEKKSLLEDDLKATKETEEAKTKEEKLELEKRKANRKELIETLKTAAFDLAQQTSDLLFDNEKSRLEKQKEAGLAALEEEYAKKIEFAQGNTLEIAKLEKERDEKRKKLEKEAFEQNKRVQINQAIANGALAILKAFASLDPISAAIASIGIAAQTAFQIARIKSTKYERGGLLKGKKHIQGGINLGFGQEGEDGEAIINAESTKKHYKLLSAINTDGGNGDPLPGLQSFSNPIFSQRPAIYDRIVPSNPQQYQSNSTVSVSISQKDMDMISEKVRLGIVEGTKYVETSRSKIESFRKNNSY